jgi:histidyl-tRNA synthetase
MQFDADTVGSASPAADAEVCMMAADTMEALGLVGNYKIKFSSRKILDGLLDTLGISGENLTTKRMAVLRAIDKLDRLGGNGVASLLGEGRTDESGDFTKGAGLSEEQVELVLKFLDYVKFPENRAGKSSVRYEHIKPGIEGNASYLQWLNMTLRNSTIGMAGYAELTQMLDIFDVSGYGNRIHIDPSVVRGLEYYTGPVFECELLMETKDEDGRPVRFGSVGGGGRYDDLVARFTGQSVPATGFSMGVSRLYSALKLLGKTEDKETTAPVVVLVLDKERQGDYQKMVQQLRAADIRAEMYVGTSGMKAQMKYADKRGSPLVVIQGGDEKAKGEVTLKDLALGAQLASGVESREEYASQRLAQVSVPETDLVKAVKEMLARGR